MLQWYTKWTPSDTGGHNERKTLVAQYLLNATICWSIPTYLHILVECRTVFHVEKNLMRPFSYWKSFCCFFLSLRSVRKDWYGPLIPVPISRGSGPHSQQVTAVASAHILCAQIHKQTNNQHIHISCSSRHPLQKGEPPNNLNCEFGSIGSTPPLCMLRCHKKRTIMFILCFRLC